jgi:hypothetical protein
MLTRVAYGSAFQAPNNAFCSSQGCVFEVYGPRNEFLPALVCLDPGRSQLRIPVVPDQNRGKIARQCRRPDVFPVQIMFSYVAVILVCDGGGSPVGQARELNVQCASSRTAFMRQHAGIYPPGGSNHVIVGGLIYPVRVPFQWTPTWFDFHWDKGAACRSAPAAPAELLMNFCCTSSCESNIVWNDQNNGKTNYKHIH